MRPFRMKTIENIRLQEEDRETERRDITDEFFTVEEAVGHIGVGWYHVKLTAVLGLSWLGEASEILVISILGPILLCDWKIGRWQEAFLTTAAFIGMSIGSVVSGKLADKYGRRATLMLLLVWMLYFGSLSALSPLYAMLFFLRLLTGVGIGAGCVGLAGTLEFMPSHARAKAVMGLEIAWSLGAVYVVVSAMAILPSLGWRWWLFFNGLPSAICFIFCKFWLLESPYYLVASRDSQGALEVLKTVARACGKTLPSGALKKESVETRGCLRDLFSRGWLRTTVLLAFVWWILSFLYYGVVLISTEIISVSSRNSNFSIGQEDETCSAGCQPLTMTDYRDLLVTSFAELPCVLLGMFLVDIIGRKKSMILLLLLTAALFVFIIILQNRIIRIGLLFLCRGAIGAGFQATSAYTAEVYPTTIRAVGTGFGSAVSRVGGMITPFVAQVLLNTSLFYGLLVYALVAALGAAAISAIPRETKGQSLKI